MQVREAMQEKGHSACWAHVKVGRELAWFFGAGLRAG